MAESIEDVLRIVRRIEARLTAVTTLLITMEDRMSAQLDNLTREVQESREAVTQAVARFEELAAEIKANKDDPAKIEELANELDQQQKALTMAFGVESGEEPEPTA